MSREIRFRAWDPINGRFYKNPFIAFDEYGVGAYDDQREWEDGIRRNSILMQFTGLKDKNGRDVYEGDLIRIHYPDVGSPIRTQAVIYREDSACFDTKFVEDWLRAEFEVIGNQFENPELVGEAKS